MSTSGEILTAAGISLQRIGGEILAVGTAAPVVVSTSPGGGFEVQVPEGAPSASGCGASGESQTTEQTEHCTGLAEGGDSESGTTGIKIDPIVQKEQTSQLELVESEAAVTDNTNREVDSAIRPLNDGGEVFEAIRDASAPTEYSYRVELGSEQELSQVNERTVEVQYNDGAPCFEIAATPARDAVGTEVPTSLTVSGM